MNRRIESRPRGSLGEAAFLSSPTELTPRGRACAAFADGQPLIMGTVIADGGLEELSFEEMCAWLCLFLREVGGVGCCDRVTTGGRTRVVVCQHLCVRSRGGVTSSPSSTKQN
jgi:hypothetical protein